MCITHSIYVELVSNAINQLKFDKNDCDDGLSSDNFKNGTDHLLNFCILLLFSSVLVHCTCTASTGLLCPSNKHNNNPVKIQ